MNFLQKAASMVSKIVGIAVSWLPFVKQLVPQSSGVQKAESEFQAVANVLVTGEQMFAAAFGADAKKGSDKLKAAVPFVAGLIQQSEIMVGKKVRDEAAFEAAVTAITSNFADLLNSVEPV